MADSYKTVSDSTFQTEVLNSNLPTIVDFWAPWCGPCRAMAPVFEDLAREYNGKMTFTKLNTDENQATMMKYGIQGIPTLLFFYKGELVGELVGMRQRNDLKQHIDQILEKAASTAS